MLAWYQPKPNEVNFLPWAEYHFAIKRRKRGFLYSSMMVIIVLGLFAFGLLYANLVNVQADLSWQVSQGAKQLHLKQQGVWASSLERRQMELGQALKAQADFQAWLPIQQLSKLLIMLQPGQRLNTWRWQPADAGYQLVFAVTGQGLWQGWWQEIAKVWPSIQMEVLGTTADGWTIEARYLVPSISLPSIRPAAAPVLQSFALQLTPDPLGVGSEVEPIGAMTSQVTKYGKDLEIVRGQGLHIKVQLDATQWADMAPLPSAIGWRLKEFSIMQIPSGPWQISMQWLPSGTASFFQLFTPLPSALDQALTLQGIQHYAQAFYAKTVPTQTTAMQAGVSNTSLHRKKWHVADNFQFIGYSQQQGQIAVAWIKSLDNGRLVRVEVSDSLEGWRVSDISAQGVNLTKGQQWLMLKRLCRTGVCQK